MNKRIIATLLLPMVSISGSASVQSGNERPNILCILVDDLGYGDLSCQGFAKDLQTPHIDKILNQGMRFTNFHANCPVCSPSRASLLTGRYPDMVGVPGVIRTIPENNWGYLSEKAILLPQMLKQKKYHSAIIGKWHLGLESPNTPRERGFDYFQGFLGDMMDDYFTHLRHGNNYMRENERVINPVGHATEIFSDWAIRFIQSQKGEKNPFFLYLAYNAPHSPIQPPVEWIERVHKRQPGISPKRLKLVALIEHLDDNIGRVYAELEQSGQLENTLIFFLSDNGGQQDMGANNGLFRGAKQDMFEGGICVPAGIYWKNKIKPAVTDNFAMLSDIFPTLCELTGIEIPHMIDGISILPVLKGEKQETDNRYVYWVRREGDFYGGQAYYAARYKEYKIMQNTPWEPYQFFNLKEEPSEQHPIDATGSKEYKSLNVELMHHIQASGGIPWQANK